jgi:hypothetical protein
MGTQHTTDTPIGILRRLGYVNYLLTPGVLVAVGMSGDAGGWRLPLFAITLAVLFLSMPLICSSLSKKQLAVGNRRTALIIAAIPFAVFLIYFYMLASPLMFRR